MPNVNGITAADFHAWMSEQTKTGKEMTVRSAMAQLAEADKTAKARAEWIKYGERRSPEWRQRICEGVFGDLHQWRQGNFRFMDAAERAQAVAAGPKAKKAALKIVEWNWDKGLKWRNYPSFSSLDFCLELEERALLNAWVAREGGFVAIWEAARGNADLEKELCFAGKKLTQLCWAQEAQEWARGFASWRALEIDDLKATADPHRVQKLKDAEKNLWSGLFAARTAAFFRDHGEKIKTMASTFKELGLVPASEADRAEWLSQWIDNRQGATDIIDVMAHVGFSLKDRSPAVSYVAPLPSLFLPNKYLGLSFLRKFLEMGENPLEKNAEGIDAWTMARAANASGSKSDMQAELEKRVTILQERDELAVAMKTMAAEKEAQLGQWALAVVRLGGAFDAQGKKLNIEDLEGMGPLFVAEEKAAKVREASKSVKNEASLPAASKRARL